MILFLSDVAGSEVLLILVFILIFFGSKSIPGIARTFGRTIRQIKDASQDLQDEIRKSTADMKGDLNLSSLIEETSRDIQKPFEEYASDLDESIKYDSKNNYFVNKQAELDAAKNESQIIEKATETSPEKVEIIKKPLPENLPLDQQGIE
jgi:sec-independent protein translocase protein TatA